MTKARFSVTKPLHTKTVNFLSQPREKNNTLLKLFHNRRNSEIIWAWILIPRKVCPLTRPSLAHLSFSNKWPHTLMPSCPRSQSRYTCHPPWCHTTGLSSPPLIGRSRRRREFSRHSTNCLSRSTWTICRSLHIWETEHSSREDAVDIFLALMHEEPRRWSSPYPLTAILQWGSIPGKISGG